MLGGGGASADAGGADGAVVRARRDIARPQVDAGPQRLEHAAHAVLPLRRPQPLQHLPRQPLARPGRREDIGKKYRTFAGNAS